MATISIPVTCQIVGGCTVQLMTIESGQQANFQVINLEYEETSSFELSYYAPGVYTYTVKRLGMTDENADGDGYKVEVYVMENVEGKLTAVPVIFSQNSVEKKTACIITASSETAIQVIEVDTGDRVEISRTVLCLVLSGGIVISVIRRKRGGKN